MDSSAAREEINANNRLIEQALRSANPALIADLYTPEAILMPPNSPPVAGLSAILEFWQEAIRMGVAGIRIETDEIETAATLSFEQGRYTLYAEGGVVVDDGKYLVVWKAENRGWKLHRDIWNSNRPLRA